MKNSIFRHIIKTEGLSFISLKGTLWFISRVKNVTCGSQKIKVCCKSLIIYFEKHGLEK